MEGNTDLSTVNNVNGEKNSEKIESLTANGKNKYPVTCARCPSRILNAEIAEYKKIEFSLPHMTQSKDKIDPISKDNLNQYWLVNDKFDFENVGFSNTVSGLKYLTCADCEIGPIGWHDPDLSLSYIAVSRVNYHIL